jgi:predicted MPP superfamily phosphohydrolase
LPRLTFRRSVIGAFAVCAGSGATIGVWSLFVAPRRPRLERVTLPLTAAHAHLAGLRIGFITDTHIGPTFSPSDLERAAFLLADERPDLILMGGDFASESPRYSEQAAGAVAPLVDVAPLGAYAVLGNHDMECGAKKVTAALAARGIRVLRNEAVAIETGRGTLWIAGIDEVTHFNHDAKSTFAQIPPGEAVISLWHEPDFAEQAAERGAFAQLSGHTHGGQIRFPFIGPLVLPRFGRRFIRGVIPVEGMTLYVSRGAGVYRPPVRFRCPPEVTLVTLGAPLA